MTTFTAPCNYQVITPDNKKHKSENAQLLALFKQLLIISYWLVHMYMVSIWPKRKWWKGIASSTECWLRFWKKQASKLHGGVTAKTFCMEKTLISCCRKRLVIFPVLKVVWQWPFVYFNLLACQYRLWKL